MCERGCVLRTQKNNKEERGVLRTREVRHTIGDVCMRGEEMCIEDTKTTEELKCIDDTRGSS